ncbi:hypothetical protein BN1723_020011, partial [Verticillium longisporum]
RLEERRLARCRRVSAPRRRQARPLDLARRHGRRCARGLCQHGRSRERPQRHRDHV